MSAPPPLPEEPLPPLPDEPPPLPAEPLPDADDAAPTTSSAVAQGKRKAVEIETDDEDLDDDDDDEDADDGPEPVWHRPDDTEGAAVAAPPLPGSPPPAGAPPLPTEAPPPPAAEDPAGPASSTIKKGDWTAVWSPQCVDLLGMLSR